MTYSQCPFEPVVKGRDATAKAMYKLMRWTLRKNWRKIDSACEKALESAMVTGTGYFRVQAQADGSILTTGGPDVTSKHGGA
jgi:hypothetical protein